MTICYVTSPLPNGQVSTWDFWDIMDLLDDKILDNSAGIFQSSGSGSMGNKPAELPVFCHEMLGFRRLGGAMRFIIDQEIIRNTIVLKARHKGDEVVLFA